MPCATISISFEKSTDSDTFMGKYVLANRLSEKLTGEATCALSVKNVKLMKIQILLYRTLIYL